VDPGWASYRKGERLTTTVLGMLPTPTVGDAAASGSRCHEGSSAHPGVSLTDVVVHGRTLETHGPRTTGGRLEPQFVEWLMGLPLGWTEPDSGLLATPLFLSALRSSDTSSESWMDSDRASARIIKGSRDMRLKEAIDATKYDIRILWTGLKEEHVSPDAGVVEGYPLDPPDTGPGWLLVDWGVESLKDVDRYWTLWIREKTKIKVKGKRGRPKKAPTAVVSMEAASSAPVTAPKLLKPAKTPTVRKPKKTKQVASQEPPASSEESAETSN
jgi:hypothetical protein